MWASTKRKRTQQIPFKQMKHLVIISIIHGERVIVYNFAGAHRGRTGARFLHDLADTKSLGTSP